MRIQWGYAVFYIFFLITAGVSTFVYKVGGPYAVHLFTALSVLGLTGSALFYSLQQKWQARGQGQQQGAGASSSGGAAAAAPAGEAGAGDVDLVVRDAEAKLAAAKLGDGKGLSGMPVIFLLGDQGSTKTTLFMHSGLEPELLSGQVHQQDNTIAPTRAANVWYTKKAVFVEAGGRFWLDQGGWMRLLKKLSPGKLKSVFGGKGQAPRAAVLCVDVERFFQAGASDTMAAVARGVQTRLNEISQQFGISFPVYALFTRSDRVPFFLDFVRNLSHEEGTQVFGVTLPMRSSRGGVYAEEETQRLNQAFNDLFYSLCDKRIEFLPRENDQEKLPGCYEFPREFRKLRTALVQFLVDVGRPSQLRASPFVRGFYFCGVRPVFVQDVAPTPFSQRPSSAFEAGSSATRMFRVGDMPQAQVPMAAPQQSGGRKMPQWVFLSHLFNDVILADKSAMGASEASTKTSGLQRLLLGLLAMAALVWSIGMTVSFFQNRSLVNDITEAAQQVKAVRIAPAALPSEDDLKKLKGLRGRLEQLTKWNKESPPWSYRWGLYMGQALYRPTRKAYYDGFQNLLFRETQMRIMLVHLQTRESRPRPEDDCGYSYETLRAYLITTSQWKRVAGEGEPARLKSVLQGRWAERREGEIGPARLKLADEEVQFYSSDLANGNPFSETEDATGVHRARVFLSACSGLDAIYGRLINDASGQNPPVNYNAIYRGTEKCVLNNRDIRGAFTRKGWEWMKKNAAKNLAGDEWVLGPPDKYPRATIDPRTVTAEIWRRYSDEYIGKWREYFQKNTTVLRYAGPKDAADKLAIHASSLAPVLALIALATQNTAVEGDDEYARRVRAAFLWAFTVVPAPGTQVTVGKNEPYVNALGQLQAAVAAFAANSNDQLQAQMSGNKKTEALATTANVARAPMPDLDAKLDQTILAIMEQPIKAFDPRPDPGAINAAAGAFCKQFSVVRNKFPFNPTQRDEVTLGELNSLLRPESGIFWQFYKQQLEQYIKKSGNTYMPVAGAPFNFSPQFLNFFNQVAALSDAMYRSGNDPRLNYQIKLSSVTARLGGQIKSARLTIDGKDARMGAAAATSFVWSGDPSHGAVFEANDVVNFNRPGMWSIFRFFANADPAVPQGSGYLLVYPLKAGQDSERTADANFIVDLGGAPPVFDKRFLSGLSCISTAASK